MGRCDRDKTQCDATVAALGLAMLQDSETVAALRARAERAEQELAVREAELREARSFTRIAEQERDECAATLRAAFEAMKLTDKRVAALEQERDAALAALRGAVTMCYCAGTGQTPPDCCLEESEPHACAGKMDCANPPCVAARAALQAGAPQGEVK